MRSASIVLCIDVKFCGIDYINIYNRKHFTFYFNISGFYFNNSLWIVDQITADLARREDASFER